MNLDLKQYRIWAGLSQTVAATRAGLKQGTWGDYERGSKPMSNDVVNSIADAITPTVLFIHLGLEQIASAMLAVNQIDCIEHEPDDFNTALKQGQRIAVITDDKEPFLALIKQALEDSGLPNIPMLGIKIDESGKVEPWND